MPLPKRKNGRLPEYGYSACGAYFITICTKNRACISGATAGADAHIVREQSDYPYIRQYTAKWKEDGLYEA